MKGFHVDVYRMADGTDCTLGGVTSQATSLTLIGPGVPEHYEPTEDRPGVRLIRRTIGGREYISAVPLDVTGDGTGQYMFGGNYIACCDSRIRAICPYPIPVHDRAVAKEKR